MEGPRSPRSIRRRGSSKRSGPATNRCVPAMTLFPFRATAKQSHRFAVPGRLPPKSGPARRTNGRSARTPTTRLKPLWGKTENLHWRSDDFDVQGWLMYPVNYDPSKKYPMVVSVHGGPAAAKKPSWPGAFDMTLLSSQGYFVLFPNPRGSYGAGEAFTKSERQGFRPGRSARHSAGRRSGASGLCPSIQTALALRAGVMAAT